MTGRPTAAVHSSPGEAMWRSVGGFLTSYWLLVLAAASLLATGLWALRGEWLNAAATACACAWAIAAYRGDRDPRFK